MNERTQAAAAVASFSHADALDILARADAERIKAFAEKLLDELGPVQVLASRTGLAMLPYVDTVQATAFHLGEVLMAEAHIRLPQHAVEGYGAVIGRDLEQAMAMAITDASLAAKVATVEIESFLADEYRHQNQADDGRLRKVEATRVRMETF
ncbi:MULTISPECIES: phosphonate C-P lyase system protein PhnG [unclassified Sinorhizobium]|uniref:phosphonate C-P lyase system protein PhnG n=1 Tax=unclassified Sinorhizobium TaxID=2613772 RepID=UPI0035233E71